MIRDTLRAILVVATLAAAAGIVVEARFQLAAIDAAHRATVAGYAPAPLPPAQAAAVPPPQPGRLRSFGRAAIDLADAAIGIVR
jgi:hypothetical protein